MKEDKNIISQDILDARQGSRGSIVFGFIMSILGIFTVLAPVLAGIAVTFMIGTLLIMAGFTATIFAFKARSFGIGVLKFLFGALGVVSGIIIISIPEQSLGILTYILAVFFLATGITDIILSVQARTEDSWGWILFNGIISILFGIMIIAQWPASGLYAVGIYVGVRIMMQGWAMIALGRTGQMAISHLQDTRIADLETLVAAGAKTLKKTQLVLAEHTAMLAVLADEMKDKVSASGVDPTIRELNHKLGEARSELKKADEASKKSWARVQKEANASFEKLQRHISEVTKDMKNSLGLDKVER